MPRPMKLCKFSWHAEALRNRLKEHGIDEIEFRRRLVEFGVPTTPSRVNRWLNGSSVPGVEIACAIARVFNCSVESLLEERP